MRRSTTVLRLVMIAAGERRAATGYGPQPSFAKRFAKNTLLLITTLLVGLSVAAPATVAEAQTLEETVTTLGDLSRSLVTAALDSKFDEVQPVMTDSLVYYVQTLDRGGVNDLTLDQAVGIVHSVDWKSRLRWRQEDYRASFDLRERPGQLDRAIRGILRVVNTPGGLDDHLYDTWGEAQSEVVVAPVVEYQGLFLERSLANSLEKLRRFEIKYGPGSAKLNFAETLLNYGFQWVPGFGVDDRGWPGPWEWIAAYDTSYLTVEDEAPEFLSGAEIGFRRYQFGPKWKGFWKYLQPRSIAAGGFVSGDRNGAFVWPGRGESRWGAFFAWGPVKVAYVDGDERRLAFTHSIQLIPGLF